MDLPSIYAATQVLCDFRDLFIADMDANTVVWELLYQNIIPHGVQERISRTDKTKQQNEILYMIGFRERAPKMP